MRRHPIPAADLEDAPARPKGKTKGFPLWGWLAIGGGGIAMLCFMGMLAAVAWRGLAEKREVEKEKGVATAPAAVKKVWTEKELSEAVKGKSSEDVVRLLGEPNYRRPLASSFDTSWVYTYYGILVDGSGVVVEAKIYGDYAEGGGTGRVR